MSSNEAIQLLADAATQEQNLVNISQLLKGEVEPANPFIKSLVERLRKGREQAQSLERNIQAAEKFIQDAVKKQIQLCAIMEEYVNLIQVWSTKGPDAEGAQHE